MAVATQPLVTVFHPHITFEILSLVLDQYTLQYSDGNCLEIVSSRDILETVFSLSLSHLGLDDYCLGFSQSCPYCLGPITALTNELQSN